ncbi:MAG: DUF3307 domain-containing protein [Bacteroidia bacterium]|nr:DUF3307 domain-containing protein [Bacteroidia bacterium]NNF30005.1 DUF3307 domain-containing protein [Flavobacteriaceae bacterium]MBT8276015.1 DUF3307 domain-containing protein [Bacteroidia bacterium]NNJ81830.1 DUF3307 domain-containing protein [Flavobacteriaceae bacterium]NNK53710.1 DUF3307 domain-containing protein [Flavobacteriaceae bacterium]
MNPELVFALQLLLAHVITDFVFQSKKWIKQKRKKKARSPFLYIHAVLAGLITYVIVQDWSMWLVPVIITVTHFFIDLWKLHQESDSLRYFLWDQFFHMLVLVAVWLYATDHFGDLIPFIASVLGSEFFLVYVTGYLLVIFPIGFIIGKATQRWQKEIKKEDGLKSLEKAGRYIGIFERILVLTFILTDNFSAIGFLIAAKSILRFSDKSKSGARKQTEYVLIGTLMSFALTILIGFLMRVLIFQ